MDDVRLKEIMDVYQKRYTNMLTNIWPSIESNGFAEQNQTANFFSAYETVATLNHEMVSTWYEFQIPNGEKKNNRIDGLIVNHTAQNLYLVEAKRFSENTLNKKRTEMKDDLLRIEELDIEGRCRELFQNHETIAEYDCYGVLLFDLWTETPQEKELAALWQEYCKTGNTDILYEFLTIEKEQQKNRVLLPDMREVTCNRWKGKDYSYYLGTLIWQIQLRGNCNIKHR